MSVFMKRGRPENDISEDENEGDENDAEKYPDGKSYHQSDRADPSPNSLNTYEISLVMNDETRRNINLKRNIQENTPEAAVASTSSTIDDKKWKVRREAKEEAEEEAEESDEEMDEMIHTWADDDVEGGETEEEEEEEDDEEDEEDEERIRPRYTDRMNNM